MTLPETLDGPEPARLELAFLDLTPGPGDFHQDSEHSHPEFQAVQRPQGTKTSHQPWLSVLRFLGAGGGRRKPAAA